MIRIVRQEYGQCLFLQGTAEHLPQDLFQICLRCPVPLSGGNLHTLIRDIVLVPVQKECLLLRSQTVRPDGIFLERIAHDYAAGILAEP